LPWRILSFPYGFEIYRLVESTVGIVDRYAFAKPTSVYESGVVGLCVGVYRADNSMTEIVSIRPFVTIALVVDKPITWTDLIPVPPREVIHLKRNVFIVRFDPL
jgi:hypothetical protein